MKKFSARSVSGVQCHSQLCEDTAIMPQRFAVLSNYTCIHEP